MQPKVDLVSKEERILGSDIPVRRCCLTPHFAVNDMGPSGSDGWKRC